MGSKASIGPRSITAHVELSLKRASAKTSGVGARGPVHCQCVRGCSEGSVTIGPQRRGNDGWRMDGGRNVFRNSKMRQVVIRIRSALSRENSVPS